MAARIKLGELLVRAGVLDEFKLKAALSEQQRWGGRLGKILVEMNFLTEDMLVRALSKQLGINRARLDAGVTLIPSDILAKIDPTFCANNAICPERYITDRKTLVVAMADPTNVSAVDELRFKTGLRIETSLGGELEISQAIDRVMYGREPIDGIELSGGNSVASQSLAPANPLGSLSSSLPSGQLFEQFPFNGQNNGATSSMPQRSTPPPLPPLPPVPGGAAQYGYTGISQIPQTAMNVFSQPPHPPPPPTLAPPAMPPQGGQRSTALDMALALDVAQRKQLKAIRVMLELLIEKGVISRDEYIQLVNKR